MAKKKAYRTSKKSDSARKAKPHGYRYNTHDKDDDNYYKRPTKDEIARYLAGDKKMQSKI